MPLMWAHAEYVKLLRSVSDGKVFDMIPEVSRRYTSSLESVRKSLEIWKFNRQPRTMKRGGILRVQVSSHFRLHWSIDGWRSSNDTESTSTILGVEYVDIPVSFTQRDPICFTFFWPENNHWEGRDYSVAIL